LWWHDAALVIGPTGSALLLCGPIPTATATHEFAVSWLVPARSPHLTGIWGQCLLLTQSGVRDAGEIERAITAARVRRMAAL